MNDKRMNKLVLALVVLTGCTTAKVVTTSQVVISAKPVAVLSLPIQRAPVFSALPALSTNHDVCIDCTTSDIGVSYRGTNVIVSWPTNLSVYTVLYSTNYAEPLQMWLVPEHDGVRTNIDRAEITITNIYQKCFFALAKRTSQKSFFYWSYDFNACPMVTHFVLYSGASSRQYTNRIVVGKCRWCIVDTEPGTNYYALTARAFDGYESDFSDEAVYAQ